MKLKHNKGFTMVELIVVIGVIAVLTAMILPALLSRDSNKNAVTDAAKDYYVAAQHVMSKFAKYEADITGQDTSSDLGAYVVCYDKEFGGNRPINEYLFISMEVSNGKIIRSSAYSADTAEYAMAQVLARNNRVERGDVEDGVYEAMIESGEGTPPASYRFLEMFMDEMNAVLEGRDGFYYALIQYDDTLKGLNDTAGNDLLKVVMTGYTEVELPVYSETISETSAGNFTAYKERNLLVTEQGMLSTGEYFGIQSSRLYGTQYIGDTGTYFAY